MSGKHYSLPLIFSLWISKGVWASDLQLKDLICYFNTYLLGISNLLLSTLPLLLHNFLRMSPQYWDCRGNTSDSLDDSHCLYLPVDLTCYRYVWRGYESPALKEKFESWQLYKPHPPFARRYSRCFCFWENFFPVLLEDIWMQAILQISVTFFTFFLPYFLFK